MSIIKEKLRYLFSTFYSNKISSLILKFSKKKPLRVLIFHGVNDLSKFTKLINHLIRYWNIISPNDFFNLLDNNKEVSKPSLLITFDDGFKNNLEIVPILDNFSIKALFFVCPALVELESNNLLFPLLLKKLFRIECTNEEIKLLNWDDLRLLQSKGHSIGNHSSFHYQVNKLSTNELKDDINLSKNLFQKNLNQNKSFESFSYPFGGINHINISSLNYLSKSFNYIFSGIRGNNTGSSSKFIFRDAVSIDDKFEITDTFLKGGFDLYYKISKIIFLN